MTASDRAGESIYRASMRPRLIAVDDAEVRELAADVKHASMRPRLIAVDDGVGAFFTL